MGIDLSHVQVSDTAARDDLGVKVDILALAAEGPPDFTVLFDDALIDEVLKIGRDLLERAPWWAPAELVHEILYRAALVELLQSFVLLVEILVECFHKQIPDFAPPWRAIACGRKTPQSAVFR
jgi:hypothetical protein